MSSCACRIVAQCRALRDSDTAHSESGDAEISQAHLCRQRRRLWDWSSQSRRSAVLKEHCLLAQAQLARAVRRRRHLLTETMRDAAHLCFCAIRECKGTRVKVPERASCRARVCILHFSSAHLQGRWDYVTHGNARNTQSTYEQRSFDRPAACNHRDAGCWAPSSLAIAHHMARILPPSPL